MSRAVENNDVAKELWEALSDATALESGTKTALLGKLGLDTDLGTFSLPASATISTFGASLVGAADASAARVTLGLGTAATVNTGTAGGEVVLRGSNGSISTTESGGTILTTGANGHIGTVDPSSYIQTRSTFRFFNGSQVTTLSANASGSDKNIAFPDATGTVALTSDTRFEPQVKSSNFTAANGETYHVVASATATDPSPVEGKGFTVFVRNGTATVGGTGYSTAGMLIVRIYHSGAWTNYTYSPD